jgi:hypothetical protein
MALAAVLPAAAQLTCPATPIYSLCELVFELDAAEMQTHPSPYATVQLRAEFRSPRHRTFLMPAFWDGGNRMVIRFAPIDAGDWGFRVSGNLPRFEGKLGKFTAEPAAVPGFIKPANGYHWRYTENLQPHLWMGDTCYAVAFLDESLFREMVDARAAQKFTHMRGYAIGREDYRGATFRSPDEPITEFYRKLDTRAAYLNSKGIIFDIILGHDKNHLAELFPKPEQRERYLRYMVARYSAFNVTWQLVQEFEEYENGRALLNELGNTLKQLDPYGHPRTTHAVTTAAPLQADGWMDHILYQTSDDAIGAIEHQLTIAPAVNAEFAYEDSGAGHTHPHHVDSDTFRKRLWNSFMNGQYPTFGNTGSYGGRNLPVEAKYLQSPGARAMTVWYDFVATTRYWELQPFFDLDGGRAMALPGVEYIVYVEKPSGPIEVRVERQKYDVKWLNPVTGEVLPLENYKGERFTAEPPALEGDWVLHISREGRKQGMLRSYKFESRPLMVQEVEVSPAKVPFEIAEPGTKEVRVSAPPMYSAKLTRQSRGNRTMLYLWTGNVPGAPEGYRVIGTGPEGTLRIPPALSRRAPANLHIKLYGMNANGKVFSLDRFCGLVP